jgi:hypothetical protein
MFRSAFRFCSGVAFLAALLGQAYGQSEDYRQFFKRPETPLEFWKAMNFEIEVGKYEIAAQHLKGFLALEPKDDDLLGLEKKEGMSAFLRLRNIPKWSDTPKVEREARKNVETLIEQVTTILKKHLSDPLRIAKYAANLSATPGERSYAINELRRSGALAMPELIRILQKSLGEGGQVEPGHVAVISALPRLKDDTVAPLLAALDMSDSLIQEELIDALQQREDFIGLARRAQTDPRPSLYYLAGSPRSPERLKKKAREALSLIEGVNIDRVPNARTELVAAAERYYTHKVKFFDPNAVTLWRWDGKGLVMETVKSARAEEHYGLRYARWALDLDPTYERAQVVFLSLAVEHALDQGGLDKPLAESAPKVKELLATVNPDLLIAALDKGLSERRLGVVLGLTRALGEQADAKAARPQSQGQPVLVKAMSYPDRRVQYAAADALLRIGGRPAAQSSGRVVDVLRRAATLDAKPRALVADFNKQRGEAVGNVIKEVGFDPVIVQTGRQLMDRLKLAGDIDVMLIDHQIFQPEVADLLASLRADPDWAAVPIIITIPPTSKGVRPPETVLRLTRLAGKYRNVTSVPATLDPDVLKPLLTVQIMEAMGQPLTEAERKTTALEAMTWLKRLGAGEVPGYNIEPAEDAILRSIKSEELGKTAIEAASHLPTRTAQRELAAMVTNDNLLPEYRTLAAAALNRSLQRLSPVLSRKQVADLQALFKATDDAKLKANLATVLGSLRPDAVRTGDLLRRYQPGTPDVAPPPKEKEKEEDKKDPEKKDKDKDKDKEKDKEDKKDKDKE